MTASVRKLAPTQVELDIEVSESDLEAARQRAFRRLAKQYRIPGFRPGHVPRRVFETHVGTERIEHEAVETLVPDAYAKAIEQHALHPVDQPQIDFERSDDGRLMRIKATVAVRPDISLGVYKGIPIRKPAITVSEDDVERSLHQLRRQAATLELVTDRGVQEGDVVTLDYAGTIDGQPFEGGTATNHTTEIAPGKLVEGFAEQLYGARPGERRHVGVTFPAAYASPAVAGRQAEFDVTIHEVKTPVLPEVDEHFVKQVSDYQTVEELRQGIRRRLETAATHRARDEAERQLTDELLARHDFPLPEVLVEREVERTLAEAKDAVARAGRSWEAYVRAQEVSEEGLKEQYHEVARRRVKLALLLEAIAEAEDIKARSADIDAEIERMARASAQRRETVAGILRRSEGRLAQVVRRDKTIDFLLANAQST